MTDTDAREKLWNLIKDIRFAMFTTRSPETGLRTRPLTTQNRREDQDDALWFFVSRDSEVFEDLQADPQVCVAYASPDDDSYVSVSGRAELVDDADRRHRLWSKMNEAWFPQGPDSPEVALVCVRMQHAEYWNVKESKPVQLLHMAKAAMTDQPPKDMGEHRQVRLH